MNKIKNIAFKWKEYKGRKRQDQEEIIGQRQGDRMILLRRNGQFG
jgi:hypothetical protein